MLELDALTPKQVLGFTLALATLFLTYSVIERRRIPEALDDLETIAKEQSRQLENIRLLTYILLHRAYDEETLERTPLQTSPGKVQVGPRFDDRDYVEILTTFSGEDGDDDNFDDGPPLYTHRHSRNQAYKNVHVVAADSTPIMRLRGGGFFGESKLEPGPSLNNTFTEDTDIDRELWAILMDDEWQIVDINRDICSSSEDDEPKVKGSGSVEVEIGNEAGNTHTEKRWIDIGRSEAIEPGEEDEEQEIVQRLDNGKQKATVEDLSEHHQYVKDQHCYGIAQHSLYETQSPGQQPIPYHLKPSQPMSSPGLSDLCMRRMGRYKLIQQESRHQPFHIPQPSHPPAPTRTRGNSIPKHDDTAQVRGCQAEAFLSPYKCMEQPQMDHEETSPVDNVGQQEKPRRPTGDLRLFPYVRDDEHDFGGPKQGTVYSGLQPFHINQRCKPFTNPRPAPTSPSVPPTKEQRQIDPMANDAYVSSSCFGTDSRTLEGKPISSGTRRQDGMMSSQQHIAKLKKSITSLGLEKDNLQRTCSKENPATQRTLYHSEAGPTAYTAPPTSLPPQRPSPHRLAGYDTFGERETRPHRVTTIYAAPPDSQHTHVWPRAHVPHAHSSNDMPLISELESGRRVAGTVRQYWEPVRGVLLPKVRVIGLEDSA
ncbi:hypothetical protein BDV95DRAFT_607592 [Massariosphaeria phaeospora]|uniref:Uncharacterized protein n=1 Tax=Massariosphaeria phaeospora TaxID=100035 RepID=A0A7C8I5I5_9PLEO|nr:hypothetical protein BDV95DRAFT_607592 [Massariosphaeria phaeospora]